LISGFENINLGHFYHSLRYGTIKSAIKPRKALKIIKGLNPIIPNNCPPINGAATFDPKFTKLVTIAKTACFNISWTSPCY